MLRKLINVISGCDPESFLEDTSTEPLSNGDSPEHCRWALHNPMSAQKERESRGGHYAASWSEVSLFFPQMLVLMLLRPLNLNWDLRLLASLGSQASGLELGSPGSQDHRLGLEFQHQLFLGLQFTDDR